jgi:hypothetical protein
VAEAHNFWPGLIMGQSSNSFVLLVFLDGRGFSSF